MLGFLKQRKAILDTQKLIKDLTFNIAIYDKKIKPSELFLHDPYVLGFIKALSEVAIMFNYRTRPSHIVAGKILCKSIQKSYPAESENIIEKLSEFNMSENEKFIDGLKLGINYGKSISSGMNNPAITEEEIGEQFEETFGVMRRYIRNNYIKN